jgi:hypothetical protein
MGSQGAGAATMRHVVLVALEALLVATLVWIAAMTLAAFSQGDAGLTGSANAGRAVPSLEVADGRYGTMTIATARPVADGTWVHATCLQGTTVVLSQWAHVDSSGHASFQLGPTATWTSGAASCSAEQGWFSPNGRWRVQTTATFRVTAAP